MKQWRFHKDHFDEYALLATVWLHVLGLAGMELIFFIAAWMVLCFRFTTKTTLLMLTF